jgi:hypothetical protein
MATSRGHGRAGHTRPAAHLDGHRPGGALEPLRGIRVREQSTVSLLVAQRSRIGLQPIDEEGRHLHLGEGPPHAVGVDHRHVPQGRDHHRLECVRSSDLVGQHGRGLALDEVLDRLEGAQALGAALDLLDAHGRRADRARRNYERLVV